MMLPFKDGVYDRIGTLAVHRSPNARRTHPRLADRNARGREGPRRAVRALSGRARLHPRAARGGDACDRDREARGDLAAAAPPARAHAPPLLPAALSARG